MYHIIVNPASKSGLGIRKWHELEEYLKKEMMTYTVYFTRKTKDATRIATEITASCASSPCQIIVLGGDGTMNEVVNGISDFEHTTLIYLPAGSSNDLARDLHIRSDVNLAIARAKQKTEPLSMDYGTITYGAHHVQNFLVSCGIGYDAAVCEAVFHAKAKSFLNRIGLGKLVYLYLGVKLLFKRTSVGCDLYLDDHSPIHFDGLMFAAFMIHRYEGGGFKFCPRADYHDGLLDICLVNNMRGGEIFRLLPLAFFGKHIHSPNVHIYRAKKIRIKTSDPLFVHTDGEICGKQTEITVTCHKNGLNYK